MGFVNILKLCVGAESIEDLALWQEQNAGRWPAGMAAHVTRMWPKREAELLDGGSIYWVFKGVMQARQRILRLDEVKGEDGIRRCALVLEPQLFRVAAVPRRPFQGWRYLEPDSAPRDLGASGANLEDMPEDLKRELAELGLL